MTEDESVRKLRERIDDIDNIVHRWIREDEPGPSGDIGLFQEAYDSLEQARRLLHSRLSEKRYHFFEPNIFDPDTPLEGKIHLSYHPKVLKYVEFSESYAVLTSDLSGVPSIRIAYPSRSAESGSGAVFPTDEARATLAAFETVTTQARLVEMLNKKYDLETAAQWAAEQAGAVLILIHRAADEEEAPR